MTSWLTPQLLWDSRRFCAESNLAEFGHPCGQIQSSRGKEDCRTSTPTGLASLLMTFCLGVNPLVAASRLSWVQRAEGSVSATCRRGTTSKTPTSQTGDLWVRRAHCSACFASLLNRLSSSAHAMVLLGQTAERNEHATRSFTGSPVSSTRRSQPTRLQPM